MDLISRGRNDKKRRISEEQDMVENMNRLGNLPDEILQHILSFLPTKVAVRTSVLSKRWRNQWIHSPNLEFVEWEPDKRELFVNFVEKVLELRGSLDIHNFLLSCAVMSDDFQIFKWIFTAVTQNVRVMKLCLRDFKETGDLPSCLFSCATLTVLKLDFGGRNFQIFFDVAFPSLKILSLKHVQLPNNYSTQCLFSGCPFLEELTMHNCDWKHVKAICISSPMLRELVVIDESDYENDYIDTEDNNKSDGNDDANDENVDGNDQTDSNGCQVVIIGTSLESFSYSGELRNDYCLYDSSSLSVACIEVDGCRCNREEVPMEVVYRTHKLVRACSNVKNLTISVDTVEILDEAEELIEHMPVFNNLTCLQSDPDATMWLSSSSLLKILQNSPHLSSLRIAGELSVGKRGGEEWKFDPVPPCFTTHLKSIEIGEYHGDEWKLDAVKVLLKYATVLQTFIIRINYFCFEEDKIEEVEQQLLRLPRRPHCNMYFD